MKTQEILKAWLKENNYDGLVYPELECGCMLSDFIPCTDPGENCEAGINRPDLCPHDSSFQVESGGEYWMVTKAFSDANPKKE